VHKDMSECPEVSPLHHKPSGLVTAGNARTSTEEVLSSPSATYPGLA
jgi:hypothetical protein